MQLFFSDQIQGNVVTLDETESKHAKQVLRLKEGDAITVVDGANNLYTCTIASFGKHNATALITQTQHNFDQRACYIHMALAPTKNIDRYEWFLEKAVEIGVDEITPLISARSERKIVKTDRIQKILISAMKQSVKASLPKLNEPAMFKDFVKQNHANLLIAHCNDDIAKQPLFVLAEPNAHHTVLIGPEGDFTAEEVAMAKESGGRTISLGNERLRTETAGVVAVHTINLMSTIKNHNA
jgi:16S rRNA (uracil1498-N3)-methyltransferase